ncbi:MAG: hypothetical protein BGO86_03960 [Chryseobacterium sp. 36-9]|nr:MAG: hypothetical protein BGO86_03960 [Chryseobacterium sp. 36-9]
MKKLILLFGVLLSISNFAQKKEDSSILSTKSIFEWVKEPAVFLEGNVKFRKILANNIRTRKINGTGVIKTEIIFVVEKDGSLSHIMSKGDNLEFNKEAERAISKIKTKWKPARIDGNIVRSRFKIPLTMTFNK